MGCSTMTPWHSIYEFYLMGLNNVSVSETCFWFEKVFIQIGGLDPLELPFNTQQS